MKIWFISDTHCQHAGLDVPSVDAVFHCGDEAISRGWAANSIEAANFSKWWNNLPIQAKVFVPGNHSIAVERGMLRIAGQLVDDYTTVGGLSVYGAPWTPAWGQSWAYMRKRHRMDAVWAGVHPGMDILLTHGPPKGILDRTRDRDTRAMISVGCNSLRKHVEVWQPKIHAFGHIHDEKGINNYGVYHRGGTVFVNCSVCDNRGNLVNNGIVLEV